MLPLTIQIYQDANRLLKEHGLLEEGWKFDFSNEKRAVGRCYHGRQLITLSKHFIDNTPYEELLDTILHEIAHALVGPDHGHDDVWKRSAISVGARPQRCATADAKLSEAASKPNYIVQCPRCNRTWKRFRLKRSVRTATHCGVQVVVYRVKP